MKLLENSNNKVVIEDNEGNKLLFSYLTLVASISKNGETVGTSKKYSATTSKHLNEFLGTKHPDFTLTPKELENTF